MTVISRSFTIRQRNGKEHIVLYSPEDHELIRSYRWSLSAGYAVTSVPVGDGKYYGLYLHRAILNLPRGAGSSAMGDHINGNRLDNRRKNLRIVDAKGNARNRRPRGTRLVDMDALIG